MHLLAFLGVAVVVIVTPGPDTALTIRNVLAGGRRAGVLTALGVSVGQAVWTLAATAGIAAVLQASAPAFLALRLLGAAYLVWLGCTTLVHALRRAPHTAPAVAARRGRTWFRQGLVSNLGNPKMAIFFTGLLPQFGHTFAGLLPLGLVFCSMTFAWLCAYSIAVARAGDMLRRSRVRRTVDAVAGTVLVAFGVRLASETRV
jgi:threonine/homoserine/homoserine lactone efflux protein